MDEQKPAEPGGQLRQYAEAAESAVIIQVGGDLIISDGGRWLPVPRLTPQLGAPGECPYPGLQEFGFDHADLFFGREKVTGELLRHLDEMMLGGSGPLLVVGPSGAGKSSLLGAGLLGAVARGQLPVPGSESWPWVLIRPGRHPVEALRDAVATVASGQEPGRETRTIVVVDQLEEIFTVCDSEAERAAFIDEVARLVTDTRPGSALVVLGLRADFYPQATGYPLLHQAMQKRQVVLGAMTAEEVRRAITSPAGEMNLGLEPGLADLMLHDLTKEGGAGPRAGGGYQAGQLPLLAHALRATWELSDRSRMTIKNYQDTMGIGGSISRAAEDAYRQLDGAGQGAAQQLFLNLIRVGEASGDGDTTADTRRRVTTVSLLARAADPVAAQETLRRFTDARLLIADAKSVEITHETLLTRWHRLRDWIDEDRAGHLVRQQLEDAATAWATEGRDAGALYSGIRLVAARAWAADPGRTRQLSPPVRDFLDASERRRRHSLRIRNGIIAILAVLSLVLAGLAAYAQDQRSVAQANLQQADAGLLAAESGQAWADIRPDTAQQLAVAAYRLDPASRQVRNALLATQALPIIGRLTENEPGGVVYPMDGLAYSPLGTVIAGATDDGYVHLWSASTHRQVWAYQMLVNGQATKSLAAAFSADGKILAATSADAVWLWNVTNPARPAPLGRLSLPRSVDQPNGLAFSPDGSTLAVALVRGAAFRASSLVQLWSVARHVVTGQFEAGSEVASLAFTPGGRSIVTGSSNGAVSIWNLATRTRSTVLQQAASLTLGAVAVSPDGQTVAFDGGGVASGSTVSYRVELWHAATGKVTTLPTPIPANISALGFSPDGGHLAVGSSDGSVRLFDTEYGYQLIGTLTAHRSQVNRVAFSPDGGTLADASNDGTIALWDARDATLDGHVNLALAFAFSPDGRTLAVATLLPVGRAVSFGIGLYSMPSRKLIRVLPTGALVYALAFSPDGRTVAAAPVESPTGAVQLWNVATGELTGTIQTGEGEPGVRVDGLPDAIKSIAFSPDGSILVTSGQVDTTFEAWSVTRHALIGKFSDTQQTQYPAGFGGVNSLTFSRDGRLLAVDGLDDMIRLYSVPGFAYLGAIPPSPTSPAKSLVFSPDGRILAVGYNNGTIYLYPVPALASAGRPAGQLTRQGVLTAGNKSVNGLQFTPGGQLVSASFDGDVRIWNVPSAAVTSTTPATLIPTHAGPILGMSYSPALGLIATETQASGTRIWQTSPALLTKGICQSLQAPVAQALWTEYVPSIPYIPVCGG